MFENTVARLDCMLTGIALRGSPCGECVLDATGSICPMACPKGLRNGPCCGTLNGHCAVYPDRSCVWVHIHERTAKGLFTRPRLFASPDARAANDVAPGAVPFRKVLPYLDLGVVRVRQPVQTSSQLEQWLKRGKFVKTCEICAPRSARFDEFVKQAETLTRHFGAVAVVAPANGKPALPSSLVAAKLVDLGIEAICESSGRDQSKTSFIAELLQNQIQGVHNVLCVTGDVCPTPLPNRQVFEMDSASMLYEARHLRETGVVHFTGDGIENPPCPYLGAKINPFSEPVNVPIRRLKQKISAGADFILTPPILDVPRFRRFVELAAQEWILEDAFLIASVPVVTSLSGLLALSRAAGVAVPMSAIRRLEQVRDVENEGIEMAKEIVAELRTVSGLSGVHLVLFGPDYTALTRVIEAVTG